MKLVSPYFQEKPLGAMQQTDTGGWVEHTKNDQENMVKELEQIAPVTSEKGVPVSVVTPRAKIGHSK